MQFIIQRPIEGITLNGLETLMGSDGNAMTFNTEEEAKAFLFNQFGDETQDLLDDCAILINKEEEQNENIEATQV
jgi:hypothetical protein